MNPRYTLVTLVTVIGLTLSRSLSPVTAAPPAPAAGQPSEPLPPGHPPIQPRPAEGLPAGHPPIGGNAGSGSSMGQLPKDVMANAGNPKWTVPEGWEAGPVSSVRRGSYVVKGPEKQTAEIAVTVFPGDVGGTRDNISRWRGQIGLAPIKPDELDRLSQPLEVNGVKATIVDLKGEKPPMNRAHPLRMVVVTLPREGNSWFFKLTGDAPLVEAQKAKLIEFVKSVRF